MIGWIFTAASLYLLLSMKAGVRLLWKSGTATLKIRVGMFRFSFSTREKRSDKRSSSTASKAESSKKKPSTKKWVSALLSNWREVLEMVARILRTPKLDLLRLHMIVGGRDPEICAMNYGRICGALGAGLPLVQRLFAVKKQDVNVSCEFSRQETDVLAEVEVTVQVYEICALLFSGLALLIKLNRHTKSTEKAVRSQ